MTVPHTHQHGKLGQPCYVWLSSSLGGLWFPHQSLWVGGGGVVATKVYHRCHGHVLPIRSCQKGAIKGQMYCPGESLANSLHTFARQRTTQPQHYPGGGVQSVRIGWHWGCASNHQPSPKTRSPKHDAASPTQAYPILRPIVVFPSGCSDGGGINGIATPLSMPFKISLHTFARQLTTQPQHYPGGGVQSAHSGDQPAGKWPMIGQHRRPSARRPAGRQPETDCPTSICSATGCRHWGCETKHQPSP